MSQIHTLVLTTSLISAGIAAIYFRSIVHKFRPFVLFLWFSFAIDLIANIFSFHLVTVIATNIFYLIEASIILRQFRNWGLLKKNNRWYKCIQVFFIAFWLVEFTLLVKRNYYEQTYFYLSFFTCFYSLLFTIFSISKLNELGSSERNKLTKNPIFITCSGFILYFTYSSIMSVFWMPNLRVSIWAFYNQVYYFMLIILLICNLIYAYGIFHMRKDKLAQQKSERCNSNTLGRPSIV